MCVFNSFACRLPYSTIFGGAGSLTKEHFKLINGFSNKFWGWGGEDDDLYNRYMYMCNHYCWFWFLCSPTYFSVTDFFCNMKMIWTAEIQIFKWRYDHRSGNCNLNNCKYPPPQKKKMGGLQQDLNPWPLHYSCSTLALILSCEDPYIKWQQTNLLSLS